MAHEETPVEGVVEKKDSDNEVTDEQQAVVNNAILANISQYTDRPDLLIKELEKGDPGFIKRANDIALQDMRNGQKVRYGASIADFAGSLAVRLFMAIAVGYLLITGFAEMGFWKIIALTIFLAVSQSGGEGFLEIVRGLADVIRSRGKGKEED